MHFGGMTGDPQVISTAGRRVTHRVTRRPSASNGSVAEVMGPSPARGDHWVMPAWRWLVAELPTVVVGRRSPLGRAPDA
jgi:hypothetical protein